jgi:hypothetical protein
MHLRARVATLVHKREPNQLRTVLIAEPRRWPLHLRLAWVILRKELKIPAQLARTIVLEALNAAYECAQRMNKRTQAGEVRDRSKKVKAAFQRLSRCTDRAPAMLRDLLKEQISAALKIGDGDLETIEALIERSRNAFEQFPDAEPSKTALSALGVYKKYGYDMVGLVSDFSALSPPQ